MRRSFFIIFFLILFSGITSAQNFVRLRHMQGTRKINGISVTVTSKGGAEELYYCDNLTGPYYIGYSNADYVARTGSYTFTFKPAVKKIKLNVAAMSTSDSYHEEVEVYVNGKHHKFTKAGGKNSCEDLAIINKKGNIAPCEDCSGSGMNNLIIDGPIETITVKNIIAKGEPMGSVFAMFFDGKLDTNLVVQKDTNEVKDEVVFSENNIPVKIKGRDVELQKTITVNQMEFDIEVWDRSVVDGDSISLNLNGEWVLTEYKVVKKKKKVHIKLNPNFTNNYIILYALNLGSIAPNTAAVQLTLNGRTYRLTLNSDLDKSGALNFEYKPDE